MKRLFYLHAGLSATIILALLAIVVVVLKGYVTNHHVLSDIAAPTAEQSSAPMMKTAIFPNDAIAFDSNEIEPRNYISIFINRKQEVLVGRKLKPAGISVKEYIRNAIRRAILNEENDQEMPSKRERKIMLPNGEQWQFPVSEYVVSIQSAREVTLGFYNDICNIVMESIFELRNELALRKFGKSLDLLSFEENIAISEAVPMRVLNRFVGLRKGIMRKCSFSPLSILSYEQSLPVDNNTTTIVNAAIEQVLNEAPASHADFAEFTEGEIVVNE